MIFLRKYSELNDVPNTFEKMLKNLEEKVERLFGREIRELDGSLHGTELAYTLITRFSKEKRKEK